MGLVDGSTDTVATWTDPVQCTGEDGKTNSYMDFKYAKSAAETIPPPLDRTVRFPEGWTDEPPTLIKGEFMWMINALIDEMMILLINGWVLLELQVNQVLKENREKDYPEYLIRLCLHINLVKKNLKNQ